MNITISPSLAVSDNGFIFSSATGDTFTMNQIGLEIIKMIRENKSEEEIIKSLFDSYDIDVDTLHKDFNDFLSQLKKFNIVEIT